jgi:hypothetical protein
MNPNKTVLAAAAAALLAGCAASQYSEPYAVFEAEHRKELQGVIPATVMRIDGREVAGRKDPVKPGPHTLELAIAGLAERKTLSVDAQACMRYYVGARRSGADITPFVSATETIGECRK